MTEPEAVTGSPSLTVEAMRRLCQEMMKNGHGDYTFVVQASSWDYSPENATADHEKKEVRIS